jgi:hypothetical protein
MKTILSSLIIPFFLFWASAQVLLAGQTVKLTLDTGEVLIGAQLPSKSELHYALESSVLGSISIPKDAVVLLEELGSPQPLASDPALEEDPALELAETAPQLPSTQNSSKLVNSEKFQKVLNGLTDIKTPLSWSGNLKLGMNLASGSSQYVQTFLRGKIEVQEADSPHSYGLSGEYNYRESERASGEKYISSDRYNAEFTYRWLYSERWFLQNTSSLRTDNLKGIDNELKNLTGIGYRIPLTNTIEILLGSGIGIQNKFLNTDGTYTNNSFVLNLFQELEWKPSPKISLNQEFNFLQNPKDSSVYSYEILTAFNYRLSDFLGLEMRYTKNYDNNVQNGSGDDTRLQNALTFYF